MQNIEWTKSPEPVSYTVAYEAMRGRVEAIYDQRAPEQIWLLEHPSIYTMGPRGQLSDRLEATNVPLVITDRGGLITYHGPGQLVVYTLLNLNHRRKDLHHFVHSLETWIQEALSLIGLDSFTVKDRIGVWVKTGGTEKKIAAIGLKSKKWVTFHGFSININPDLSHFEKILPCGIKDFGVTSLHDLGYMAGAHDLEQALQKTFKAFLGRIQ